MSVYEESDVPRLTKGEQRLLDEFAKAAMQGMLAFNTEAWGQSSNKHAYDIAYAMIAERRRRLGENTSG